MFTRQQALDAGIRADEVRWRRDSGLWVPALGRALRHVDQELDRWSHLHAAQLTWPDGVVVLGGAAFIHRVPTGDDGDVHMVVPRRVQAWPGLIPHRFGLDEMDVQVVKGVTVTTPFRTLMDCLGLMPLDERRTLAAYATARQLITTADITRWLSAGPRRGNAERRRLLEAMQMGAASTAELLLHEILRAGGLRGWVPNAPIRHQGRIIASADVLFRAARLVIEVDGFAFHGRPEFQRDRTRQNALVEAGYRVLRFTWKDLTERPDDVLRQVRAMLRASGPTPSGHQ